MSEELLDLVKCCPIVDERAGKAVAQIVNGRQLGAYDKNDKTKFVGRKGTPEEALSDKTSLRRGGLFRSLAV